jgi:NTE family protein
MAWLEEADGVFRGGGVKGLGLAGALLGFAEHPEKPIKEWVNVAGASAGAIIACYLAVNREDGVEGLEKLLRATDFRRFQDFPHGGEVFGGGRNLLVNHGLAHGEAFRSWFDGVLGEATFSAVKTPDGRHSRLKLIAVDVTNRQLLLLPDDLPFYRRAAGEPPIDPDTFKIADAARMSMSIPYFFEPVQLVRDQVRCAEAGDTELVAGSVVDRLAVQAANARCTAAGQKPAAFEELAEQTTATIIDGGTLSNFPVWVFDVDPQADGAGGGPKRLTFGFTLTGGRGVGAGVTHAVEHLPWLFKFGFDIFHTAQEAWDTRFVSHSTRVRTVAVDAGDVGTTDFGLDEKAKDMLVGNGRAAAKRFLDRFDPAEYVNTNHAAPAFVHDLAKEREPQLAGAPA